MKHYVGPARYSTQNISISASTKPIDIGFLSDTLSTAVSINKRSQERTQPVVNEPDKKPIQSLAIDNTQYRDVYEEQEEIKHRRTYGAPYQGYGGSGGGYNG